MPAEANVALVIVGPAGHGAMASPLAEDKVEHLARLASRGDEDALTALLAGVRARVLAQCREGTAQPG